ncbi:Hypp6823 [Branchiostoma lanceolatum]|uniref:Hypp6823 protein n=1 Tax=Branchiostoma lanceolatum TaxID=7740 RepID=A0A8J9YVG7_BRALA|nr:Hypp6823 [Branchiostoma lanceolatum]
MRYQYTPSRKLGHERRITVVVPFSKQNFRGLFLQRLSLPVCQDLLEEKQLENCFRGRAIHVPGNRMTELYAIIGKHWDVRTFPTNTVCPVIREERVHLPWGFKRREIFSHENCPSCRQDWSSVSAILENAFCTIKSENPRLCKVFLRSDNAGCYHCAPLLLSMPAISQKTGISVLSQLQPFNSFHNQQIVYNQDGTAIINQHEQELATVRTTNRSLEEQLHAEKALRGTEVKFAVQSEMERMTCPFAKQVRTIEDIRSFSSKETIDFLQKEAPTLYNLVCNLTTFPEATQAPLPGQLVWAPLAFKRLAMTSRNQLTQVARPGSGYCRLDDPAAR